MLRYTYNRHRGCRRPRVSVFFRNGRNPLLCRRVSSSHSLPPLLRTTSHSSTEWSLRIRKSNCRAALPRVNKTLFLKIKSLRDSVTFSELLHERNAIAKNLLARSRPVILSTSLDSYHLKCSYVSKYQRQKSIKVKSFKMHMKLDSRKLKNPEIWGFANLVRSYQKSSKNDLQKCAKNSKTASQASCQDSYKISKLLNPGNWLPSSGSMNNLTSVPSFVRDAIHSTLSKTHKIEIPFSFELMPN